MLNSGIILIQGFQEHMTSNTKPLLTILLPFHHEEQTLASVLSSLKEHLAAVPHEVLLIHDDTNDPTVAVINNIQQNYSAIHILLNQYAAGVPGALRTGLDKASGSYVLFLVADDPSPVPHINSMINLLNQGYDLVSVSRYTKGGKAQGGHLLSQWLSAGANRLFITLTGSKLSDITCGFKMFKKSMLSQISLKSNKDWTLPIELAIEAQYYDFKVTEIPLISNNRLNGGQSHFRIMPRVLSYARLLGWGIIRLWTKRSHV